LLFTLSLVTFSSAQASFGYSNDLWKQMSRLFSLPHFTNEKEVAKQIMWIKRHPTYVKHLAERSRPYIYYILEQVRARKIPGEVALLPMIESSYNPFAHSSKGAAGLWQLMPGTGTGLGLRQDWWYDGRRGIHSSTNAALNYLEYLNQFFQGNWILAIAAYDSGEGTVQRAVQKNQKNGKSTEFWSLGLPRETKAYIPRLLALAAIIDRPRYYGINLPSIPHEPYFDVVDVGSQIDLKHAAKLANISYSELIKLNPGYNRWATAPGQKYQLVIPLENIEIFKQNLQTSPKSKRISWKRHRVKIGESLGIIAQKYKTRVSLVKEINKLASDKIKEGKILLIPGTIHYSKKSIIETHRQLSIDKSTNSGPTKVIHIVKKGDSLNSIAKKYYTKPAAIEFWNRLTPNVKLTPGKKIVIWIKKSYARTYKVKSGDNLSVIAYKHRLSLKKLKTLNPSIKASNIKPGQVLRLA
jgi:membrane-bound lytic murein transglycosylase D